GGREEARLAWRSPCQAVSWLQMDLEQPASLGAGHEMARVPRVRFQAGDGRSDQAVREGLPGGAPVFAARDAAAGGAGIENRGVHRIAEKCDQRTEAFGRLACKLPGDSPVTAPVDRAVSGPQVQEVRNLGIEGEGARLGVVNALPGVYAVGAAPQAPRIEDVVVTLEEIEGPRMVRRENDLHRHRVGGDRVREALPGAAAIAAAPEPRSRGVDEPRTQR